MKLLRFLLNINSIWMAAPSDLDEASALDERSIPSKALKSIFIFFVDCTCNLLPSNLLKNFFNQSLLVISLIMLHINNIYRVDPIHISNISLISFKRSQCDKNTHYLINSSSNPSIQNENSLTPYNKKMGKEVITCMLFN